MSIMGPSGVPLAYVIQKQIEDVDDYVFENDVERLIHGAPLEGPIFNADHHQVSRIIKSKLVGTDNWEWIIVNTIGPRMTMLQWTHSIRTMMAQAKLHYKSEPTFSFEQFITKLNGAYQLLQEHKEGLTKRKKLSLMCDKILNNNPLLITAVQCVHHTPDLCTDFWVVSKQTVWEHLIYFSLAR